MSPELHGLRASLGRIQVCLWRRRIIGRMSHKPTYDSTKCLLFKGAFQKLACVASVSVWFRSKERGTRVEDRAKNGSRFISRPAKTEIPVSWSFFAPKPNGNACYAGYPKVRTGWPDYGQTIQFDNKIGFFQQFLIKKTISFSHAI